MNEREFEIVSAIYDGVVVASFSVLVLGTLLLVSI